MTEAVLEARDVSVAFGGLRAVQDVSIDVEAGQVAGLLGPNGAGKSTLFNAITGHQPVTAGTLMFLGRDVTARPAWERARMGMARSFQLGGLIHDLTALENVVLGCDHAARAGGGPRRWRGATRRARARARELLRELGLDGVERALAHGLPAGTRRRIEVARAVAAGARLVLLDEPAAGLSETERAELGEMFRTLAAGGTAVLITDHTTDMVLGSCDWVYVMNFGQRIAAGPPAEIRADSRVIDAYLGHAAVHA